MKNKWKTLLTVALLTSLTTPALASSVYVPATQARAAVGFNTSDRNALNDYVTSLPSGLREASAGAHFRVGESLPQNAAVGALPSAVTSQISPAPNGYSYVQAGSDVYLISNANRQIIDRVGIR